MTEYLEFLEKKKVKVIETGFEISTDAMNPMLFEFQRFCVQRALKAGKYALFQDCGLGKTLQQLEWSKHVSAHTGMPVLILAPLAVVGQTIQEGAKFGIPVERLIPESVGAGIYIANYEQLDNIDASLFAGVVLDECFAPDTRIQVMRKNKLHNVHIKDCKVGDKVLNCTGLDTIKAIKTKKIPYAIRIRYNGKDIISSPRHPYFTQRGWVAAKEIQRGDVIISTDKAMRILRGEFSDSLQGAIKDEVLQSILFSEMANATARTLGQSTQSRSSGKAGDKQEQVVQNRCSEARVGATGQSESDGRPEMQGQSFSYIEGDEAPTFSAWGQWSGDDIATAINEGCIVRQLDSGICHITGQVTEGLPNELQSRLGSLRSKESDRTGWSLTPQQEKSRPEERHETSYFRVESFEVLEQGCNELDRYRDETGSLYFYDLEIERHPSFTINEGLVHNSSILKNFEGAMRNAIIEQFSHTRFKLACTATPSPNDPMELGNHAEFLNVMSRAEMLAMYFVHDGGETSKWKLKGHCQKLFWEWVSSWAIMLANPSDIGFDGANYVLPELKMIERQIITPQKENGQLFNNVAVSATDFNGELRLTKVERLSEVAEIVNNSTENFIIWVKQNEEADYIKKLIPDAIEVRGNEKPEEKERKLLGFANNEYRVLVTKTKIASMGLNYQNCHNQVFASLDFSFEGLYQAIRRSYRFGQTLPVNIYLITTDTMQNVIQTIKRKQDQFITMQNEMAQAVNRTLNDSRKARIEREAKTVEHENYTLRLGDCVQLIQDVPSDSVGFSVFSPPFSELYVYSDELEDMGNSKDYNEFLIAFNYLVKELYRVLWSGRNVAVHCMDLPIQKGKEGYIGLRDFSGMIHQAFTDAGFIYHSRVTIWKNPVTEMQRTKALGLLHKQVKKDSAMSRVGIPDYLMVFRKPGEHLHPVKCDINVDTWQKYASPVWMDIDYGNTLNGRAGRDQKDMKHICPLQLDTIERAIHLWSNKGDTVLSPFGGVGSEAYQAVLMDRKAVAFELKTSYFNEMVKNVQAAQETKKQISLF